MPSCSKETLIEKEVGSATTNSNNIWIANTGDYRKTDLNLISIGLEKRCDDINFLQIFLFQNIPFEVDTVKLGNFGLEDSKEPRGFFWTYECSYDAVSGEFNFYESNDFENWLSIDKIINNTIEGSFQVAIVKNPLHILYQSDLTDTMYFTNGKFELELFE